MESVAARIHCLTKNLSKNLEAFYWFCTQHKVIEFALHKWIIFNKAGIVAKIV